MFHAVPAHLQPHGTPQHPHPVFAMNPAYPTVNDATMFQGFPVTLNDGRSMMYLMPPSASPTTPTQPAWAMVNSTNNGQCVPATTATTSQPEGLSSTWCSSTFPSSCPQQTPSLASDVRRSPTTPDVPPPYVTEKTHAAPFSASATSNGASLPPSSTASLLRPSAAPGTAASYNGMSATSAFDVSTTSNMSAVANGSAHTPSMPTILRTAPVQPQQQQQQPCFWVDSTTGMMRAVSQEEMAAMMTGRAQTAAAAAVPAYALAPAVFNTSANTSILSASLSGALPYMPMVAMAAPPPPPPAAAKTMNGLQYVHGELYEGFVKRYNPNRGFGFLTATHHVRPEDGATSASGSAAASLTTAPTTGAKERRVPVHLGDIFVHQSYMHMQGFRTLPVGGRVRFRVGYKDGQQTFQAVDVELLPQVVPQGVEATNASPTAAHTHAVPYPITTTPPSVAAAMTESEKVVGSPSGSSDHHSEVERFFFAMPKESGLSRSPVTLTQGESVEDDAEDDSPLIELAYEVYTSLEE